MSLNSLAHFYLFDWLQFGAGFLLALAISLAAYFARSLSRGGAIAATLLGTAVFGLGGFPWAVLLLGFFISSSLLSRTFRKRKSTLDEKFSKSSRRDAGQVMANGGVAGILVIAQAAMPESSWPWLAGAATLAAVNADTWATELGVLSAKPPRLITTGKITDPGASGAISLIGTVNAAAGALLIAILAQLVWPYYAGNEISTITIPLRLVLITLAGLAGSLLDSLLGATLQAIYYCPTCQKETERHPLHTCGTPTHQVRGIRWLNNDWVNGACAAAGAIIGIAAAVILPAPLGMQRSSVQVIVPPEGGSMAITSSAFTDGQPIPVKYSCKGEDVSPPLTWQAVAGAQSYALIVEDPDAPSGTFTHWVLYNLPGNLTSLAESVPASAYSQGKNSFGKVGYSGPCPPAGKAHRYNFILIALDLPPTLRTGLDRIGLYNTVGGHIINQSRLMGTFQR
jgi:uncharacterized protein (TIGR00297 family)/Raf kinase inhibitor-like YbhB/YbcL family protein